VLGLYLLTKEGKKTNKQFKSVSEVLKAWESGKLNVDDVVKVGRTTTTPGRLFIQSFLPDKHLFTKPITAKVLRNYLAKIAKERPKDYSVLLDKLKEVGLNAAYFSGFSFGLDDLSVPKNIQKQRDKIVFEAMNALRKAETKQQTNKIMKNMLNKLNKLVEKLPENNAFRLMVESGSRGGTSHLRQMLLGNAVQDLQGDYIEFPIIEGYAQGLDIPEYLTSMYGSRAGALAKVKEVSEPGRLTKLVMNSVLDLRVTETDCGTTRGIKMSVDDPNIVGRYLAGSQKIGGKKFAHNTLVTPELLSYARKYIRELVVRSPLRCEAVHGVCQKCLGRDVTGQDHPKGDFVGVKAAHAVGEPTTQLALNRWHVGTGDIGPFKKLSVLLEFPENIPNEVILAEVHGRVEAVIPDPELGGHRVIINKREHWVPADREVIVKRGQSVTRGDAISSGIFNPIKFLKLRGIEDTQDKLVEELDKTLSEEATVSRKNLEVLVKALTNTAKVIDRGSHPYYVEGDYAPISYLEHFNKKVSKKISLPPKLAIGMRLAKSIGGVSAGTLIDEKVFEKIQKFPVIEVKPDPVKYEPVLRGVNTLPLDTIEDILARLNFEKLKTTIIDTAAKGGASWPTGPNPIPALATGMRIPDIPDVEILLQHIEFPTQQELERVAA